MTRRDCVALLGAGALAACSRGSTGPVLRVADQLQYLQALFGAAGPRPPTRAYRVEWSNFVSGPAVISAATGGSVDLGWMATTPLIFAQAAGSPVKVVAAFDSASDDPENAAIAIVVRPGSPIRTLADLKGARLCFALGTITQYLAFQALRSVGLTFADVQPVISTVALAGQLLSSDRADALVAVEPLLSTMIAAGDARVIATSRGLIREVHYLVATETSLGQPSIEARIGDFIARTGQAMRWWHDNPAAAARQTVQLYRVPEPVAVPIARRIGRRAIPIDAGVVAFQQQQADAFRALGQIPRRIEATRIFDRRFEHRAHG